MSEDKLRQIRERMGTIWVNLAKDNPRWFTDDVLNALLHTLYLLDDMIEDYTDTEAD